MPKWPRAGETVDLAGEKQDSRASNVAPRSSQWAKKRQVQEQRAREQRVQERERQRRGQGRRQWLGQRQRRGQGQRQWLALRRRRPQRQDRQAVATVLVSYPKLIEASWNTL